MRVEINTTLGSSPGNLVFNRDMFVNIPLIADWHGITLQRENQKMRPHDYLTQQCIILTNIGDLAS